MFTLKLDIEKFDENGDFSIWMKQMRVVLVQKKFSIILSNNPQFQEIITSQKKSESLTQPSLVLF